MPEQRKTFKCELCGKIFTIKKRLDTHIYAVHEGKKPFKCDICDYTCSQKSNMKKHVHLFMKVRNHSNVTFVTTLLLKRVT